nr:peptidylprolyl isomerase [Legionella geestiana]
MAQAQPLDSVVAVVNDAVITSSELDAQVEATRKQIEARHMQVPPLNVLRRQVLQHLIDVDLQLQIAKQNGLTIDNAELNDTISKIAESNHLNITQLREALASQGMDWASYRENIRKEILMSRLQQKAVGKDINITSQQVEDYLQTSWEPDRSDQLFRLQNIVIPLPEEPTPAQIEKARRKALDLVAKLRKGENFETLAIAESSGEYALEGGDLGERHLTELPEVFAKEVVRLKVGEVAGPLRTGNGFQLIKLASTSGRPENHQVTKTHVRHILLKQDARMTTEEARRQINNLYQQLQSGKDFAKLAQHYSLDAASAVKGGDLGWVTSGEMVPEFEKVMDKLAPGKISKPFKSRFGWHLAEVLERKIEDDTANFKRQQVRQLLHQRKFNEAVQNWQQHLRADAYVKILDKALA